MKTTTTETFDKNGKVVKRITVTEDEGIPIGPVYPAPILPAPHPVYDLPPYPPVIISTITRTPLGLLPERSCA